MTPVDILVGEDNEAEFFFIERIAKSKNPPVNCFYAKNGARLWDYIKNPNNPLPKLIVLDLHMPVMDGLEVLEKLRNHERTATVPVIMYSSSLYPEHIKQAYKFGANSYILKPGNYQELKRLFENIIQYWINTNKTVSLSQDFSSVT